MALITLKKILSQKIILCILAISLFLLFLNSRNQHYDQTSKANVRRISERYDRPFSDKCLDPEKEARSHPRMNATFMILARNSDLNGVLDSMSSLEQRFNKHFNYPYVFLNDEEFSKEFKLKVQAATQADCKFGSVDKNMWGYPEWIDEEECKERIRMQGDLGIMYGSQESYHHMCRFFSGMFFNHPLLLDYEWYWRVEPDVKFFCDITYDPFFYMQKYEKLYGFVIAIKELVETVPNLFRYASYYKRKQKIESKGMWEMFLKEEKTSDEKSPLNEQKSNKENSDIKSTNSEYLQKAISHNEFEPEKDIEAMEGETYNMCHFWSNFEIANLNWLRSVDYQKFFEVMDKTGGFWYERWGDAPLHSLAVGILLAPDQVHYFRDIGYQHTDIHHCLKDVGCRCDCPTNMPEVETKEGGCIDDWVRVVGGWVQ